MCVPPFVLLPIKLIGNITLIPWLWGFFSYKILNAENTEKRKGGGGGVKRHICALIPAEGRSLLFHPFPHLSGRYCIALDRNATPKNVKMLQEKGPTEKSILAPFEFLSDKYLKEPELTG